MPKPALHLESAKEHLAEHGETRAKDLADAIGVAPGTLQAAVVCAVRDGHIVRRQEGRAVFFSLPDGEPQPVTEEDDEQQEFNAAAWADGDVDLYGLIPLDDGGFRMSPEMVLKLKRIITWMPAS